VKNRNRGQVSISLAIQTVREQVILEMGTLDETYKRLINPHRYKVSI
jgi:hypothetical protein